MTRILTDTFANHADMSKKAISRYLKDLLRKLDEDNDPDDTLISDLDNQGMLDDLELSFLYLYLQMCYSREFIELSGKSENIDACSDFPCRVYFFTRYSCLLIDTPAILGSFRNPANRVQENLLKVLVMSALKKYELDNDFDFTFSIRAPYSIGLYRRCLPDQSSTLIPDIDNIEAGRIINSLAEELSLDDSYSSMISNVNTIEYIKERKDCGTSILLVEEARRNELEREFLKNGRSFSFIRTCK